MGGGSSSSNPVLAEATTANAFKAYDVASVSTYFPSFLAKIYDDISNSGNSGKLECADGGTVDVEYYQFDADVPTSELLPVKHVFSSCKMHIGSYIITLDGTTRMARTASKEQIVGFAKEGFSFKVANSPDITYKNFPLQSDDAFTIAVAQGLAQGDRGSFFGVAYIGNSEQVEIHSALHEKTLGDVLFTGSFLNAVNIQIDDSPIINGVFYCQEMKMENFKSI